VSSVDILSQHRTHLHNEVGGCMTIGPETGLPPSFSSIPNIELCLVFIWLPFRFLISAFVSFSRAGILHHCEMRDRRK
jgi:hypothetical protein